MFRDTEDCHRWPCLFDTSLHKEVIFAIPAEILEQEKEQRNLPGSSIT